MILGTAGHIDHGKTTLVQRLTGIETDRLKEEKQRGITIELGFAHLDLADGRRLGVVDVPGHERFVRHMVAGSGGIDVVMMVVAADEGVMPQTREHLEICELMGVRAGFVVLSKVDTVDEEWLALVEDDLTSELEGTFLEDAPIVGFSAFDPASTEAVRAQIEAVVESVTNRRKRTRSKSLVPRLPIDRVFSVKGFGTVVTGTLVGGPIALGDELELVPGNLRSKARGLQSHGEEAEMVEPGSRVAINLAGLKRHEVHRGQVIAPPGRVREVSCLDASLELLAHVDQPLRDRTSLLLHTLTQQVNARVVVLGESAQIEAGESGLVQLRTEEPVAVVSGDRFVIRGFEEVRRHGRTLGGGTVLDPGAPRFRQRHRERHIHRLRELASGDVERAIAVRFDELGLGGSEGDDLTLLVPFEPHEIAAGFEALRQGRRIRRIKGVGARYFSSAALERSSKRLLGAVAEFHEAHPEAPGIDKAGLRGALDNPDGRVFDAILSELEEAGALVRKGEFVRATDFVPPQDDIFDDALFSAFDGVGLAGFALEKAEVGLDRNDAEWRAAGRRLLESGRLTRIKPDYLIASVHLTTLRTSLTAFFAGSDSLSIGELREISGLSRKHLIPLVEYLDRIGWTRRSGDARIKGPSL